MKLVKHFLIIVGYVICILTLLAALFGVYMSLQLDTFLQTICGLILMATIVCVCEEGMDKLERLQKRIGY